MRTVLYRLGHTSAAHPWRVLLGWVLALAVAAGVAASFGGETQENWDVPGARAQQGVELLRDHGENAANADARVVVHDDDGTLAGTSGKAALADLAERLSRMPHAASVSPPRFSQDGDTALLSVEYDAPVTHRDLLTKGEPLVEAVTPTRESGLQVELNGTMAEQSAEPMKGTGEMIGIAAALLILVLAFGSVVAAGLPIGAAVVGLVMGGFGTTLLAGVMDVSPSAPMVATMVGLGVGIDYALLLVVRFAEHLREGAEVRHAAGLATATAGRSVVFAASTVLVSLMGLGLAGLPTYSAFGLVTAMSVASVAAASLTLVPALCRLGNRRILARAERRADRGSRRTRRAGRAGRAPLTARWAARVGRRPLPWALGAAIVMLSLAAPVLDMRTWPSDMSVHAEGTTLREGYDLVAEEFGPGANGAMLAVVDHAAVASPQQAVSDTVAAFSDDPRIATVMPPVDSRDGELTMVVAEPTFGPADPGVSDLVRDVRADLPAGVELTGLTPLYEDISLLLSDRLWVVIAFVVGMSFLLLTMMFRSVLVPVKAAVMNLLSITAAYGVLTMVFQWGWGAELLGLDHSTPVSSWMPILLFAILFGLSMDYEVFLLGRIREDYDATGDARGSVVRGLAATGRVISCAAAIMVAVFIGFAAESDPVIKQLGLGMGVAVALDATIVRMVLVPATMSLLGDLNWWMPRWLDRLLPRIDHDGHTPAAEAPGQASDEPELVGV